MLYDLVEVMATLPETVQVRGARRPGVALISVVGGRKACHALFMTDEARAHLKKVIDLLEPNVWLELDEVSFPRFFDGPLRRGSDALEAAKVFADQHGAVLIFLTNPRVAKFGRAYIKQDD